MKYLLTLLLLIPLQLCAQTDTIPVYFEVNEAWPTMEELNKFTYNPDWKFVEIYAYTDYRGGEAYNETLSKKRATYTRAHLLNKGCPPDIIKIYSGKGISQKHKELNKNRRADIVVYYSLPKAKVPKAEPEKAPKPVTDNSQLNNNSNAVKAPTQTTQHIEKTRLATEIKEAEVGESIILKDLSFIAGTHRLEEKSYASLDTLIAIMISNPNLKIAIEGHICCVDNPELDGINLLTGRMGLSKDRARYIYAILQQFGIEKNRMTYRGMAKTKPLFPLEQNEAEEQANRRVEIIILEK